ncbi:MAG: hypothetical protein ACRDDY_13670 [Clostridium sp.]|uniref:hypothetical protein n=1 Tax=Clostridium sp. TaxID=1506 RepID=UPI003EE4B106
MQASYREVEKGSTPQYESVSDIIQYDPRGGNTFNVARIGIQATRVHIIGISSMTDETEFDMMTRLIKYIVSGHPRSTIVTTIYDDSNINLANFINWGFEITGRIVGVLDEHSKIDRRGYALTYKHNLSRVTPAITSELDAVKSEFYLPSLGLLE